MSEFLPVRISREPCRLAGQSAQWRSVDGLFFRRNPRKRPGLSWAAIFVSLSGTTDSTPLIVVLIRLLGAVVQSFLTLPKRSHKNRSFPHGLNASGAPAARFDRRALGRVESIGRHSALTFRGTWRQTKPGDRFDKRRLLRMNQRQVGAGR